MAKKEVNIPLRVSDETAKKLDALKEHLVRPSRNNTIEFLIDTAFKENKLTLPK